MSAHQQSTAGPVRTPRQPPAARSCDRCRRRKSRCVDGNPCKLCAEARVQCTFDAPVLKRGPRPKPDRSVESRLRNLEQILATMSRESTDKDMALTEEQLRGIWAAAQVSPGSTGAPSEPPQNGVESGEAASAIIDDTTVPLHGVKVYNPNSNAEMQARGTGPTLVQAGMLGAQSGLPSLKEDIGDVGSWLSPSADAGSSTYPDLAQYLSTECNWGQPSSPFQTSSGRASHTPPSVQSWHNLLYQDGRGQTKWLGASSGMPLLDLLKELNVEAEAPRRSYSSAENWISMSTALGLNYPFPTGGPSMFTSNDKLEDLKQGAQAGLEMGDLWPRVTAIAPQLLLDNLIQAYFTTSHLLWPILHAPHFMSRYVDPQRRRDPSFVALVISMACLSSRYVGDLGWGVSQELAAPVGLQLLDLCQSILQHEAADREDVMVVQAIFNMAVYASGTSKPYTGLIHLSRAITIALQTGLHRRVNDWEAFSLVDSQIRTRTFWALYCLGVETSATFGVSPLLRLADCDVSEPLPVDDAFITESQGVQPGPAASPSVMAGFVASIRLHAVLERTVTRINEVSRDEGPRTSFLNMALATSQPTSHLYDEIALSEKFAIGLPGDWTFSPSTITQEDNVHFFRKTRASTLQHFIRLLVARHRFLTRLSGSSASFPCGPESTEEQTVLQQVTQAALGIIGTYAAILANGRLRLFGAHAITQLSQSGAGLVGVILQVQGKPNQNDQYLLRLAIQGLSSSIALLRQLGTRRPAGTVSANILEEFSRACRLPVVAPLPLTSDASQENCSVDASVPMLRRLPRRMSRTGQRQEDLYQELSFDDLLRSTQANQDLGTHQEIGV